MAAIHITDIEAAINHWRARMPSPDGVVLAPAVQALAEVYADLVYRRSTAIDEAQLGAPAMAAWLARVAGAVSKRCSFGPPWARWKNAPPGSASSARARPGASTAMSNVRRKME